MAQVNRIFLMIIKISYKITKSILFSNGNGEFNHHNSVCIVLIRIFYMLIKKIKKYSRIELLAIDMNEIVINLQNGSCK